MPAFKFKEKDGGYLNEILGVFTLHEGSILKLLFTPRGLEATIKSEIGKRDVFIFSEASKEMKPAFLAFEEKVDI